MKHLLVRLVLAGAIIGLVQDPLFAADKIRVAVANFNISFMTAGVAANKGFFRDEGLEPEIIGMRPPVSITALASGDIDYTTVFGSVVRAAIRAAPCGRAHRRRAGARGRCWRRLSSIGTSW